jgi:hypothetical protein
MNHRYQLTTTTQKAEGRRRRREISARYPLLRELPLLLSPKKSPQTYPLPHFLHYQQYRHHNLHYQHPHSTLHLHLHHHHLLAMVSTIDKSRVWVVRTRVHFCCRRLQPW